LSNQVSAGPHNPDQGQVESACIPGYRPNSGTKWRDPLDRNTFCLDWLSVVVSNPHFSPAQMIASKPKKSAIPYFAPTIKGWCEIQAKGYKK